MDRNSLPVKTPHQQAHKAAQAAVQAALALRQAGFHEQAKAIWNAAKEVVA